MVQAFAVGTLHVCRKAAVKEAGRLITPPEIEVVPAGAITELPDDDFKTFEAAGAARRPSKVDKAVAEGEDSPALAATAARPVPGKPAR